MDKPTPQARLAMLEALIHRHAQQQRELADLTRRLLDDGVVSPGELMFLHQRAQAAGAQG